MPIAKPTSIVLTLLALLMRAPIGPAPNVAAAELAATQLRCEYLKDPLGIETTQPRLSWILTSDERGQKQTAYQVLVASSESLLNAASGRPVGQRQGAVRPVGARRVRGQPLASGMQCFWKVRVWGVGTGGFSLERTGAVDDGAARTGRMAGGASGSARTSERQATRRKVTNGSGIRRATPRPLRRRACATSAASSACRPGRQITAAKFHLTCDNGFALFVNGVQAGQSTDWTQPPSLDIKEHLTAGENTWRSQRPMRAVPPG